MILADSVKQNLIVLPRLFTSARTRPANVGRWVNAFHPGDLVAAVGMLTPTFAGIESELRLDIPQGDCHQATAYLRDAQVLAVLREYLED